MISLPHGWTARATGGFATLTLLDAPRACTIGYQQGLAPLAPVRQLVRQAPLPAGFTVDDQSIRPIERVTTDEGEYGALTRASARIAGGGLDPVVVCFGFVLLDDSFDRVVGVATDRARARELEVAVRQLVTSTAHVLGNPRRRRFLYEPPRGWMPMTVGWETTWLAPQHPQHPASISISPAVPTHARTQVTAATLLRYPSPPAALPPGERVTTSRGLHGDRWSRVTTGLAGRPMEVVVASVSDRRHDYVVRLVAPQGSHADRRVFDAVVDSIQPLPRPAPSAGGAHVVVETIDQPLA